MIILFIVMWQRFIPWKHGKVYRIFGIGYVDVHETGSLSSMSILPWLGRRYRCKVYYKVIFSGLLYSFEYSCLSQVCVN